MLKTANVDAILLMVVSVIKINIGIPKHAIAAANPIICKTVAIVRIMLVEELNTGTLFNANVYVLSQVQLKQLKNLQITGSILKAVNGFQDHSHVLQVITGTLIQNLACV